MIKEKEHGGEKNGKQRENIEDQERFTSFAFAEDIFTTKEAAEARLKELQEKQL